MKKLAYYLYRISPKFFKKILKRTLKSFLKTDSRNLLRAGLQKSIVQLNTAFSKRTIEFVSFQQMQYLCDIWLPQLGRDFDIIVGIPRSGLLVANVLSLKLGKPLTTPDNIGTYWCSKSIETNLNASPVFLLVDDSYQTGASMDEAVNKLLEKGIPRERIKTASLVVSRKGVGKVDFYAIEINEKRVFEWNLIHKKMNVVTDMDGVLCEDPPEHVRDDEVSYAEWIANARPLLIPSFEIGVILTSRIEKYRPETEAWLGRSGVKYKKLVMSKELTREAQRKAGLAHKIIEINNVQPDIYWESGLKEAKEIYPNVTCPVLSLETKVILSK